MTTRLLFVTKTTVYGGTEKHLVDLIQRLDSSLIECTILCYGSDVFSRYISSRPNVRVVNFGPVASVRFLSYWLTFTKRRPWAIVFVDGWLGLFPWYAYLAAKLSGATRLFAIEHLTADPAPLLIKGTGIWKRVRRRIGWQARIMWKLRLSGMLADQTICVSNAVRERLVSSYGYPEAKTMTVLNGVDLKHFDPTCNTRSKDLPAKDNHVSPEATLLCIGNLWKQKRVDLLLDALSVVVKDHPLCKCMIVGSGPLEAELRAQSIRLGLDTVVQFVGRAEDVRPYLEAADLFVLSSENEGLPLVLGEAMAYGIPCIATDVGGNKEIVSHGQTGLLVKPGAPEQLAVAIKYLLAHPEDRCRMGANARRRVHEHFNIEDSMREVKRVLLGESLSDLVIPPTELRDESR
jgi:glycosyltransferase involved in cell wall biosynthesis